MSNMTPYNFVKYSQYDDEEPCLPPKKAGERYRYIKITFADGVCFRGYEIFDNYVRALKHIGFDVILKEASRSNFKRGGAPIVANHVCPECPHPERSVEIDGCHILSERGTTYRAFLNQIARNQNRGIDIELI